MGMILRGVHGKIGTVGLSGEMLLVLTKEWSFLLIDFWKRYWEEQTLAYIFRSHESWNSPWSIYHATVLLDKLLLW
jgi:hypothetical protein